MAAFASEAAVEPASAVPWRSAPEGSRRIGAKCAKTGS